MVMSYFVFNNINSNQFRILVNKMPPIHTSDYEVEYIEIPGRDGYLTISKDRKAPIEKTIEITILSDDYLENMKKWLKGSGNLILSNEPDVFFKARIQSVREYWGVTNEKKLLLNFKCQPYGYLHSGEKKIEITTKPYILNNPSDEKSKPFIRVYGTGLIDLIINDQLLKLNLADYIDIDSELMVSYRDINLVSFQGEYPVLKAGENIITWDGNITKLEIIPRWRK